MGLFFIWDEFSSMSISTGMVILDSVQLATLTSDLFRVLFVVLDSLLDMFFPDFRISWVVVMVGFWVFFWSSVIFG